MKNKSFTHRILTGSLLASVLWSGCSRSFWREQADDDSYQAITEKLTDQRWAVPRIDVNPDPRSRFFDPYNPDAAPLPPDDPAANVSMNWVDGWEGYKCWHKFGTTMSVENPQWLSQFGMTPEMLDPETGEYIAPVPSIQELTLRQAAELQLIHDREYQRQLEEVYLAALTVASERFAFGVRYLSNSPGGREPGLGTTTTIVPHGDGDATSLSSNFGVSQLLPAGTQWALELTNNTLWLFSGGTSTASVLSYSITQPLLAGAGRKVVLESLTQSERDLLYQIRTLARFRKLNFSGLVTGSAGFLGLLQQLQSIRNEQGNIARLEEQVERLLSESQRNSRSAGVNLENLPPGYEFPPELDGQLEYRGAPLNRLLWRRGTMSKEQEEVLRNSSDDPAFQQAIEAMIQSLRTEVATLDVLQLQSDLQDSRNRLRVLTTNLDSLLDRFKVSLGLPPDMQLSISDRVLDPFAVIDPQLIILEEMGKDFNEIWAAAEETDAEQLETVLNQFSVLVDEVEEVAFGQLDEDGRKVKSILPDRLAELATDAAREQLQTDIDRADFLLEEARRKFNDIRAAVDGQRRSLMENRLDQMGLSEVYKGIGYLREDLVKLVQSMTVIQISYRVELIKLLPYENSMQRSVEIGLENRLDLMNARATVMDARRQVEIAANLLRSNLDLRVEGDFRNAGDNPLDFRGELSDIRFGLGLTTPLDQISERETYRRALISYQRAKRAYMEFEDNIKASIRNNWRNLEGARNSLEIARRSVRLAALQYDSAVIESSKPPDPRAVGSGNSGLQGRNLTQALNSVLRAQNQLIGFWIDYESNRINIHRDMGIMEIGPDGVWEDEYYRKLTNEQQNQPSPQNNSEPLLPELPDRGDGDVGVARPGAGRARTGNSGLPEAGDNPFATGVRLINGDSRQPDYATGVERSLFDYPFGTRKSR